MNVIKYIPLEKIDPNPFQTRASEDPEHIKKLALSIIDQGLLQIPIGRWDGARVQLAFGHSRLAAYRWIVDVQPTSNVEGDFSTFPVAIRELNDQEMFELAVRENNDRRDISPIETARAMLTYREHFGKTSAEIGALFGLSESAVRNKMRLVELPEAVQEQIGDGISEGTARKLLTVRRIVKPEAIEQLAGLIERLDTPQQVNARIIDELSKATNTVKYYSSYDSDKSKAKGFFPLDWEAGELPAPTMGEFKKLYSGSETFRIHWHRQPNHATRGINLPDIAEWDLKCLFGNAIRDTWRESHESLVEGAEAFFEALDHLIRPPACSKCPYFTEIDGYGFCGQKVCFNRKVTNWLARRLMEFSEKTGIPVYDPQRDGKLFEAIDWWDQAGERRFEKWHQEKVDFLRLRATNGTYYGQHPITKDRFIQVISFHPGFIKKLTEAKPEEDRRAQERRAEAARDRRRAASEEFLKTVAAPLFGESLFAGMPLPKLAFILSLFTRVETEGLTNAEKLVVSRSALALYGLQNKVGWERKNQGPVEVAEYLTGLARSLGIELPADWLDQARAFAGVSTETEG